MDSSLAPAERVAFALLATYLLHSTLVLCGAWLLLQWGRLRSDWLIERTWKTAAAAGLVTAPLSVLCGFSQPIYRVTAGDAVEGTLAANHPAERPREHPEPLRVSGGFAAGAARDRIVESSFPRSDDEGIGAMGRLGSTVHARQAPPRGAGPTANAVGNGAAIGDQFAKPLAPTGNRVNLAVRTSLFAAALLAAAALLRLAIHVCRLRRRLARRQAPGARATAALSRVLRKSGSRRRVRLLVSDDFAEPIACGLFRGTIVLPRNLEVQASPRELEALLAHEAAHLLRGDTRWLLLGRLLCACFPFQPLNFLARRGWRRAEEFLCDQWAVRHGANSLALANCLTAIAEQRLHTGPEAAGVAVGGDGSSLSLRVERLVNGTLQEGAAPRPLRCGMMGLVAAALAAVLSIWGPQGLAAVDDAPRTESAPLKESAFSAAPEVGHPLREEFALLHEDWRRAEGLLERLPKSPEADDLLEQLRRRMAELRRRAAQQGFDNPR